MFVAPVLSVYNDVRSTLQTKIEIPLSLSGDSLKGIHAFLHLSLFSSEGVAIMSKM